MKRRLPLRGGGVRRWCQRASWTAVPTPSLPEETAIAVRRGPLPCWSAGLSNAGDGRQPVPLRPPSGFSGRRKAGRCTGGTLAMKCDEGSGGPTCPAAGAGPTWRPNWEVVAAAVAASLSSSIVLMDLGASCFGGWTLRCGNAAGGVGRVPAEGGCSRWVRETGPNGPGSLLPVLPGRPSQCSRCGGSQVARGPLMVSGPAPNRRADLRGDARSSRARGRGLMFCTFSLRDTFLRFALGRSSNLGRFFRLLVYLGHLALGSEPSTEPRCWLISLAVGGEGSGGKGRPWLGIGLGGF